MVLRKTVARFAGIALLLTLCNGASSATELSKETIATIDGTPVRTSHYIDALRAGLGQRFYHGNPSVEEMRKYGEETLQQLIERELLLAEAHRLQLQAEPKVIEEKLARLEQQYAGSEEWRKQREQLLPLLRQRIGENRRLELLRQRTRQVAEPDNREVLAYYQQHPDKFTTPERIRVSLILLGVTADAGAERWQASREEAARLIEKLKGGADFSELAHIHSTDSSAEQGGDMGYIHKGMLAIGAQQAIDRLSVGGVTPPVTLLEGIGIFRLDERINPQLNPFEEVAPRARELLKKTQVENAMKSLIERLRQQANIIINQQQLEELMTPIATHTQH